MVKQKATNTLRGPFRSTKHMATWGGVILVAVFLAVFFDTRIEPRSLDDVAERAGMSSDDLLAIGPRIASQSGATLGSSRHVVYLLACSGVANRETIEAQALQACKLAKQHRLTDREAVVAMLAELGSGAGIGELKDC